MRAVLIALACLTLAACNMVVSEKPLFAKADEDAAAPLREGWWVKPDKGCEFDAAADPKSWPECASPQLFLGGRIVDPEKPAEAMDYTGRGTPRILQIAVKEKQLSAFAYAAMRPVKSDARGRVVEARLWLVLCGEPPPKPKEAKGPMDYATRHPVRGLTVDKETGNCWATEPEQVRRAAAESETWDDDDSTIRWAADQKD